jgi:hypothetical protein
VFQIVVGLGRMFELQSNGCHVMACFWRLIAMSLDNLAVLIRCSHVKDYHMVKNFLFNRPAWFGNEGWWRLTQVIRLGSFQLHAHFFCYFVCC